MKDIKVLLSTYNGEKYLEEQINSLLQQQAVKISILARDDGSKDSTINILEKYKRKGSLEWYTGDNLRPAKSFWDLIMKAPESDYYALCDQDDYWCPDKLSDAISKLSFYDDRPALYFSQTSLVDSNLQPIHTPVIKPLCTIGEALITHCATGCTFVFNKKLLEVLRLYQPEYFSMHDNWIYRVCLVVGGVVIYDPSSHILYRQHSNNVIGLRRSKIDVLKCRFKRLFNSDHERCKIAKELILGYGSFMNKDDFYLVSLASTCDKSLLSRINLIFNKKVKCSSMKCNISSRLAILLGIY